MRGASHRRQKQPNQDAIHWREESDGRVALAVADGHGSARCFRSGEGACIAVEVATALLLEHSEGDNESLARMLVERWQAGVRTHLQSNPLPSGNSLEPYGSTILAVLAGADSLLILQLGDGDILTVSAEGEVSRPLPADPRLIGNQTTSLCGPRAWRDVRVTRCQTTEMPALILLASDGYANSFREDAGFRQVGADLLEAIRRDGLDGVTARLEEWLSETSEHGSGDDITVGLCVRETAAAEEVGASAD